MDMPVHRASVQGGTGYTVQFRSGRLPEDQYLKAAFLSGEDSANDENDGAVGEGWDPELVNKHER